MLISFPFLSNAGFVTGDSDKQAVHTELACSQEYESPVHGIYPVSHEQRWHGGVHLMQQQGNEPVRAIADGTVVAYRACVSAEDGDDTSFILLRHETETGHERPIVFYSLYMHLCNLKELNHQDQQLAKAIIPCMRTTGKEARQDGRTRVYRKDILGYSGTMHGQRMLHFEIFMTNDDFTAYFDRTLLGKSAITADGDTELWGDIYYRIPGKALFHEKIDGTGNAVQADHHILYVRVAYDKGTRTVTVWRDEGGDQCPTLLSSEKVDAGYEYTLYKKAIKEYPACPSAGYERLRFGRIIGPDKDKLTTMHLVHQSPDADETCIRSDDTVPGLLTPEETDREVDRLAGSDRINTAAPANWLLMPYDQDGNQGYIDLNTWTIAKLSDADFPPFMGWVKASEADGVLKGDGLCDIKVILDLLKDASHADSPPKDSSPERLETHLRFCDASRKKLRGLICEAPTEWDKSGNASRYDRLLGPGECFENKPQELEEFLRYAEKFQFWDKTGLPGKVWHFHPLAFIEQFAKCRWLSYDEFKQLLPDYALRKGRVNVSPVKGVKNYRSVMLWEQVNTDSHNHVFTNHLLPLNIALRKYGVNTPLRQACFFGNALQETIWLQQLNELYGVKKWYAPWYGRGFLQLTNPGNYCDYWEWRGRKVDARLKAALVDAYKKIYHMPDKSRTNELLRDAHFPALTAEMTDWRNDVQSLPKPLREEERLAPSDSAGFYWIQTQMAKYADEEHEVQRCEVPIHPEGRKVYYRSLAFWKASAAVNLPAAINRIKYSGLNGFESRCSAYGVCLAILTEQMLPDAEGRPVMMYPEGYARRKEK